MFGRDNWLMNLYSVEDVKAIYAETSTENMVYISALVFFALACVVCLFRKARRMGQTKQDDSKIQLAEDLLYIDDSVEF